MTIQSHLRLRSLAVSAALLPLALGACGDDDSTVTDDAAETEGTDTDDAAENGDDLSIEVTSPQDGDEVGTSFEMTFDVGVPVGQDEPHHIHIHVDGSETPTMIFEDSTTLADIEPGEHELEAVLVNQDHSPTDVSDTITVTAVEGGTDDGSDDDADDGSGDDADDGSGDDGGDDGSEDDDSGYDYD